MDRYGIRLCIVSSGLAVTYDFRRGNRQLADLLETEERLRGYVVVNPHYPDESLQEAERYLGRSGFVGIKIHPVYVQSAINSSASLRLLERLARFSVPLLVHTFSGEPASDPRNLLDVAGRFPGTTFLMAHMAGPGWRQAIEVALEAPNVYLEICSGFADLDRLSGAVASVGAGRVVFGSDQTLHSPGFVLGLVYDSGFTEDQQRAILHDNAEKLFGLVG